MKSTQSKAVVEFAASIPGFDRGSLKGESFMYRTCSWSNMAAAANKRDSKATQSVGEVCAVLYCAVLCWARPCSTVVFVEYLISMPFINLLCVFELCVFKRHAIFCSAAAPPPRGLPLVKLFSISVYFELPFFTGCVSFLFLLAAIVGCR